MAACLYRIGHESPVLYARAESSGKQHCLEGVNAHVASDGADLHHQKLHVLCRKQHGLNYVLLVTKFLCLLGNLCTLTIQLVDFWVKCCQSFLYNICSGHDSLVLHLLKLTCYHHVLL